MKSIKSILIGLFLFQSASLVQASIIYNIDRTIGAGTVSGFLETDGTLGTLSESSIIDWTITVTSPDINGGTSTTGSFGNTIFGDDALIATASDLFFDFDINQVWGVYTDAGDWWCLAGGSASGCFVSPGESAGYSDTTGADAEFVSYSGLTAITSNSSAVPEPASLALFGLGLAGLGMARRKKAA